MNSISGNFDMAKANIVLNQAKTKVENAKNFQSMLKTEQGKNNAGSLKSKAPVDQKLLKVCQEFESILVNQMFKAMRKTLHKKDSLLYGGQAEEIFDDMLYNKRSLETVKSAGFGLTEQLMSN